MGETLLFQKQNKLVVEEFYKLEKGVEQWHHGYVQCIIDRKNMGKVTTLKSKRPNWNLLIFCIYLITEVRSQIIILKADEQCICSLGGVSGLGLCMKYGLWVKTFG